MHHLVLDILFLMDTTTLIPCSYISEGIGTLQLNFFQTMITRIYRTRHLIVYKQLTCAFAFILVGAGGKLSHLQRRERTTPAVFLVHV